MITTPLEYMQGKIGLKTACCVCTVASSELEPITPATPATGDYSLVSDYSTMQSDFPTVKSTPAAPSVEINVSRQIGPFLLCASRGDLEH